MSREVETRNMLLTLELVIAATSIESLAAAEDTRND